MYIHVDHRWFKTILKKLFTVFLIYSIFFTTSVNASTVGGWSLGGGVAQGASTVYTGTKNIIINGADYVKKGTAIVTPTATGVAKVLAKGVAGVALSVAVEQLLGAVDWVLDAENNQIKYRTEPTECKYLYKYNGKDYCPEDLGAAANKYYGDMGVVNPRCSAGIPYPGASASIDCSALGGTVGGASSFLNPDYSETQEDEYPKSIPLEVVASKVISNAEGATDKKAGAQVATGAAAADIVAEAEADKTGTKARPIAQQLENSASTKPADPDAAANAESGTATATPQADPVTGEAAPPTDIALKFPVFCNWAPTICEAAQTVISFPQTLTEWWTTGKEKAEGWANSISESWTETKEWVKDDTKLDDADNDPPVIKDIPIGTLDTSAFKGTAGCPSAIQVPVTFAKSGNVEISYEPICAMASKWSFVAPFIGFFSGALIILGVGRKGEDSDT